MGGSACAERVEQVAGDDVAGVEDNVGVLHVVPHVGRELREVATQVGVGEDEDAERADPPIMADANSRPLKEKRCYGPKRSSKTGVH
jgi:hypothetical protein